MTLRHHFELRETIATIIADSEEIVDAVCSGLREARHEIERHILKDPFFGISYDPVTVPDSPGIIHDMAHAALLAGVGPMAAVAGTIAKAGLKKAQDMGAKYCVVDNGGDIALMTDRKVRVGLYAGDSPLSGKYAFLIDPTDDIYGICTSSATVGHSFSFGIADSVTVFSSDPILADAVATSVCNLITLKDQSCLDRLDANIDGIFAIIGDKSLIWGEIPALVPAFSAEALITRGGSGLI